MARAVWRESLMQVKTTAASTVPVACEAFQSRPASSAKTRAPPGDGRRACWVERPCMVSISVVFVDLALASGFVKARPSAGRWRLLAAPQGCGPLTPASRLGLAARPAARPRVSGVPAGRGRTLPASRSPRRYALIRGCEAWLPATSPKLLPAAPSPQQRPAAPAASKKKTGRLRNAAGPSTTLTRSESSVQSPSLSKVTPSSSRKLSSIPSS